MTSVLATAWATLTRQRATEVSALIRGDIDPRRSRCTARRRPVKQRSPRPSRRQRKRARQAPGGAGGALSPKEPLARPWSPSWSVFCVTSRRSFVTRCRCATSRRTEVSTRLRRPRPSGDPHDATGAILATRQWNCCDSGDRGWSGVRCDRRCDRRGGHWHGGRWGGCERARRSDGCGRGPPDRRGRRHHRPGVVVGRDFKSVRNRVKRRQETRREVSASRSQAR